MGKAHFAFRREPRRRFLGTHHAEAVCPAIFDGSRRTPLYVAGSSASRAASFLWAARHPGTGIFAGCAVLRTGEFRFGEVIDCTGGSVTRSDPSAFGGRFDRTGGRRRDEA